MDFAKAMEKGIVGSTFRTKIVYAQIDKPRHNDDGEWHDDVIKNHYKVVGESMGHIAKVISNAS